MSACNARRSLVGCSVRRILILLLVSKYNVFFCLYVLKLNLANSTEAELKSLQFSLRSAIDDTVSDLQQSMFKKYAFNLRQKKQPACTSQQLCRICAHL